ncbi:MAG: inositol monophosphatase [Actinobacteria bacterium]|nr:inositol monophosphatase [Actinomycetota bacterium]
MGSELPVVEVEDAMREVCAEFILPRFQRLSEDEVFEKGPGDLVTIADRESEVALTQRLRDIEPSAAVVGEEAVAGDAAVLALASGGGRVWIIDPIDGTGSFVRGNPRFAVMVALVEEGVTVGGWIWQPMDEQMFTATASSAATMNGQVIVSSQPKRPPETGFAGMSGDVRTTYFDGPTRTSLKQRISGSENVRLNKGGACGYAYPDLVSGRLDYALFGRQYPWDHAPGGLILERAGGAVRALDGGAYDPTRTTFGLLATAREEDWELVRAALFG